MKQLTNRLIILINRLDRLAKIIYNFYLKKTMVKLKPDGSYYDNITRQLYVYKELPNSWLSDNGNKEYYAIVIGNSGIYSPNVIMNNTYEFFHISKERHNEIVQNLKKFIDLDNEISGMLPHMVPSNCKSTSGCEKWDRIVKTIQKEKQDIRRQIYNEEIKIAKYYINTYPLLFKRMGCQKDGNIFLYSNEHEFISNAIFTKDYFKGAIQDYYLYKKNIIMENKKIIRYNLVTYKRYPIITVRYNGYQGTKHDVFILKITPDCVHVSMPKYLKKIEKTLKDTIRGYFGDMKICINYENSTKSYDYIRPSIINSTQWFKPLKEFRYESLKHFLIENRYT